VTIVNTTFGTSANPQKMVDALVQNPSRVRTPPQVRNFPRFTALFTLP
jgi:hypothetical protein